MDKVKSQLKLKVYDLSNKLQIILSYLETQQYGKAVEMCRAAAKDLRGIAGALIALRRNGGKRFADSVPVGKAIDGVADVLEQALEAVEDATKKDKPE